MLYDIIIVVLAVVCVCVCVCAMAMRHPAANALCTESAVLPPCMLYSVTLAPPKRARHGKGYVCTRSTIRFPLSLARLFCPAVLLIFRAGFVWGEIQSRVARESPDCVQKVKFVGRCG